MSAKSHLVLVVEDSDDCAATLEIALDCHPRFVVQVTGSAEEAMHALESSEVGAVITDLHLPTMDGLAFVSKLRQDDRFAHLPVLVISGDTDPETPRRARSAGASAFFSKPYSPGAVRQKLEELIDGR
ncbi:MAG TPA: response regulator [Bryobacteraceae bacterium]|nr:response regulator [Bryobacteraceae bacterium]